MERKELYKKLESCAYSSYEYSETAREALFALQKDDDNISSLKQEVETLKASLFIATTNSRPDTHGYWVGEEYGGKKMYDNWSCSECGSFVDTRNKTRLGKYCENCGAKMDEKEG